MLVERSGVDLASWTWLGHLVRELRAQLLRCIYVRSSHVRRLSRRRARYLFSVLWCY